MKEFGTYSSFLVPNLYSMCLSRRDKEDNTYYRLQQQSLEMLQQLSGNRWTDFNEHDPGVTIVDILNYNQLELYYQTGFDFEKYLTPLLQDELKFSQIGLLPGNDIFAPSVVTPQDYENLIKTQVEGIKECEVKLLPGNKYCILIDVEDDKQADRLIKEVENLYHHYRNLCENLDEVVLKKVSKRRRFRQSDSVEYFQKNKKIQARNAFTAMHTSIQYDFPDTYGINHQGLPANAPIQRQAQAMQLKAYLLIFDYLLSTTKQQLGGLHRMLDLSGQIPQPFSSEIDARDIELLVDEEKLKQVEILAPAQLHKKKSDYFDLLDALYGEDTSFIAKNTLLAPEEINSRRAKLIRQFPHLNRNRFHSFNLKDESLQSMPGIKKLMQAIWNNDQQHEITLESLLAHYKLRLINDESLYGDQSIFTDFPYWIDKPEIENTTVVPHIQLLPGQKKYTQLKKRLHFFSHNLLLQSLLTHGSQPENYRMRRTGFQENTMLLYKHPSGKRWLNMGFFDNSEALIQTANILWNFLETLNNRCTMFYVVENLLLQFPAEISVKDCNILYLVFPAWREAFYQKNNYLEHLQERLPIHIESWVIWLSFEEFYQFEQYYFTWRKALATESTEQIRVYAEKLKELIDVDNKNK